MVNDGFTGLTEHPETAGRRSASRASRPSWRPRRSPRCSRSGACRSSGAPTTGTAPQGATTVASLDSLPMRTNVREMLRRSDNTTAEVLLKGLAAHDGQLGTDRGRRRRSCRTRSRKLGLPTDGSVTIDGSGLDLGNRVTCDLLSAALDHQGPDSSLADDLPVAGESGTLRKRMRGTAAEGKVRAKTGTLNEVSALAGFATSASGEDLTFAFIINGALPNALTLSDQVGVALAEYGKGVSLDELSPAPAPS